jgi:cytochrome b561
VVESSDVARYSLSLRLLHWVRAALILGLIAVGYTMTTIPDSYSFKFSVLYPQHKQFGVLVWCIVVVQIAIRSRSTLPQPPAGLKPWERVLSHGVHKAMLLLAFCVPLFGFTLSSTYSHSDGVKFFGLVIPEFLPKNDGVSAIFSLLHEIGAYSLLGLVVLHVAGVVKHRFFDRDRSNDVLGRML